MQLQFPEILHCPNYSGTILNWIFLYKRRLGAVHFSSALSSLPPPSSQITSSVFAPHRLVKAGHLILNFLGVGRASGINAGGRSAIVESMALASLPSLYGDLGLTGITGTALARSASSKAPEAEQSLGLPRSARRRRQNPLGDRLGLGKNARAGCVPGRILRQIVHARRSGLAVLGSRLKGSGIFLLFGFFVVVEFPLVHASVDVGGGLTGSALRDDPTKSMLVVSK
ncbi:hypothetical protein DFH06DRAFT_1319773 [Mycena polygramma]|nr:hypothetical protein DFH06DRAFT_1319773 [Mycena polygramma]